MSQKPLEFEKPIYELKKMVEDLKLKSGASKHLNAEKEIKALEEKINNMKQEIYMNLTPWNIVQIMRHPARPRALDYIKLIFTDFNEMHGDRSFRDDKAMIGGICSLEGIPVMVIGLQKGKDTKENLLRNFGMSQPEGYRKALRLMKFAEKFGLPVITLVDTSGAFPGIEGEERGVAEAIARNLHEMARLKTPIVVTIIGEGGSGGALGIGVGDRVLMLKYGFYSVISPEGAAAILWKDSGRAADAASALKPTANDLLSIKVIDEIVEEPLEGAHTDYETTAANLKKALLRNINDLLKKDVKTLLNERYEKFRNMGIFNKI